MQTARLDALCDIRSGGTPPRGNPDNYGGTIPWVKISDIEAANGNLLATEETITDHGLKSIRGRIFPAGTLLFAIYGSVGKSAFAQREVTTNQAILGIQILDKDVLHPRYLYRWLQSQQIVFENEAQGIAQKNLSAGYVRSLEIPLPPLEEQKRIAAILDQADEIRRKRQHAIDRLNQLGQAIFHEMFGDPVTNPMRLNSSSLGDVADFGSGGTPSKARDDFWEGAFPWVSPKDMKVLRIYDAEDHISEKVFKETNLKKIQPNTPMIVVRGMILAHTVPIAMAMCELAINQDMKSIHFDDRISPEFGLWCLRAQHGAILQKVDTAAHGTKRLDTDVLKCLPILVPDMVSQNKFADRISRFEALQNQQLEQNVRLQNNFSSLQHRAFTGQL
jgi:type I restriction enzyme S subunit